MSRTLSLRFESRLLAPRERVWEWITSPNCIATEMSPLLRMTFPGSIQSLADVQFEPGVPLFRSYLFLFRVAPIDYSDLTLLERTSGAGFIEQSPMGSMKLWRHERFIAACPGESDALLLVDQLDFEPRFARGFVGWIVKRFFVHRHKVLRAKLEGNQQAAPAAVSVSRARD